MAPPAHPATNAQIKEYYELAHLQQTITQLVTQMLNGMRLTSKETVPASVWDQMESDFQKYDFLAAITPAYQRYISQEDMEITLVYMRSDAANHLRLNEPYIQSAINAVTSKAGREIGEKAARDHMDEIVALRKQKEAEAAARAGGSTAKPEIVLPKEGNPK